jgi:hypothetical protein
MWRLFLQIGDVQNLQNKTVVLKLTDGEMAIVKVNSVDVEYEDIMVDVLETNMPGAYPQFRPDSSFMIKAADILSASEILPL